MTHTQVIIIGAGPTGLMAACQLARFNINFIIIDSKSSPTQQSRAMLVTARSMEIYRQMGLANAILQEGQTIEKFSIYINGNKKASLATANAGYKLTDFANLQAFEQFKNERLLYTDLKSLGKDVLWKTSLVNFKQNEGDVEVKICDEADPHRDIFIKANYILGCDGASSIVRQQLDLDFAGGTYQNIFFVADVNLKWQQPANQIIASFARYNFCAFFPMYGKGSYRILGALPASHDTIQEIDFKFLEPVIQSTVKLPFNIQTLKWFSVYKLHHRCVNRFRIGRCFLLGDAAHIHSPAGGQGMNTGLQDAHNLAWKLAMVLNKTAHDNLLDSYHNERHPFAQWLLKFTDNIFAFMTGRRWYIYYIRKILISFVLKRILVNKWFMQKAFGLLSQVNYSYKKSPLSVNLSQQKLKFKAGDRCPHILIETEGRVKSVLSLVNATKFTLICIGRVVQTDEFPAQINSIIDIVNIKHNRAWQEKGVANNLYILMRPDQYIGLITDTISETIIMTYFDKFKKPLIT